MTIRVTVDVFSGRPNPVIVLEGADEHELLSRLGPPGAAAGEPSRRSFLGYRGLLVEQLEEPRADLPRGFRVYRQALEAEGRRQEMADSGLESWFLSSSGPLRRLDLGPEVHGRLAEELRREPPGGGDGDEDDRHEHEGDGERERCECAPLYEPGWWNEGGHRQHSNNCYNYATNYRTDTFAQPGLAAGAMYTSLQCAPVLAGAVADALVDDPDAGNRCPHEGHLVALVIAPGWDFHWYRKGRTGFWSHKPGSTPATNRDNSGNLIPDPRNANRGPYVDFCTFMVVHHGHVKIR